MIELSYNSQYSYERNSVAIADINLHYPYKSFKVFFNEENYLFTKYRDVGSYSTSAILESYDGSVLIVKQCNCGYSGHGPNNTIALLGLIGVPKDEATEYVIANNAVELYFTEDGKVIEHRTNLFGIFESRHGDLKQGQISLNTIDYFSLSERKFYFFNPSGEQILTLLQLIKAAKPTKLIYFTGKDNSRFIDIKISPSDHRINRKMKQVSNHRIECLKFAVVKGFYYDVVCLMSDSCANTIINMLSLSLGVAQPFAESNIFGIDFMVEKNKKVATVMDKVKYLLSAFKKSDNERKYFEIPLMERAILNQKSENYKLAKRYSCPA